MRSFAVVLCICLMFVFLDLLYRWKCLLPGMSNGDLSRESCAGPQWNGLFVTSAETTSCMGAACSQTAHLDAAGRAPFSGHDKVRT